MEDNSDNDQNDDNVMIDLKKTVWKNSNENVEGKIANERLTDIIIYIHQFVVFTFFRKYRIHPATILVPLDATKKDFSNYELIIKNNLLFLSLKII